MQLPIIIGLHRSFLGLAGSVVAHGAAIAGIVSTPWSFWLKAILFLGLAGSMALSRPLWSPKIRGLRLLGDGAMECRLAGEEGWLVAELMSGATVHPWLTVIRLKLAEGMVAAVVLPDSATTEEFRRLRVWLRWRADFNPGKDAA